MRASKPRAPLHPLRRSQRPNRPSCGTAPPFGPSSGVRHSLLTESNANAGPPERRRRTSGVTRRGYAVTQSAIAREASRFCASRRCSLRLRANVSLLRRQSSEIAQYHARSARRRERSREEGCDEPERIAGSISQASSPASDHRPGPSPHRVDANFADWTPLTSHQLLEQLDILAAEELVKKRRLAKQTVKNGGKIAVPSLDDRCVANLALLTSIASRTL